MKNNNNSKNISKYKDKIYHTNKSRIKWDLFLLHTPRNFERIGRLKTATDLFVPTETTRHVCATLNDLQ